MTDMQLFIIVCVTMAIAIIIVREAHAIRGELESIRKALENNPPPPAS